MKSVVLGLVLMCLSINSVMGKADGLRRYVTNFYAEVLHGYDENDPYKEVLTLKNPKNSLEQFSVDLAGKSLKAYLAVVGEDSGEGLWLIELSGRRYWVEKVAVEVQPSSIPGKTCESYAAVGGKAEVTEIAGTVGLGKECKPK